MFRAHRGKGLAAFLKAIGYLIPLMDNESANYYTREVMVILIREFQSPDEEMKKIVLKVSKLSSRPTTGVTLRLLLLVGTNFSVLVVCCIWQVLILVFFK